MDLDIKRIIVDYCNNNQKQESCGFIVYDNKGKFDIIKCFNDHEKPEHNFKISPQVFINTQNVLNIFAIFHSHISDSINFSQNDVNLSEEITIPIYLYNTKHKVWKEYLPHSLSFNLIGNPFSWSMFDCYSLVRYYYWKNLKIYLQDYDRGENVLGENFVFEIYESEGFNLIDKMAMPRDHDIIVYKNYRNLPHHLGIFFKGKIYEHRQGRLSEYRTTDFYDVKNKVAILRHITLV